MESKGGIQVQRSGRNRRRKGEGGGALEYIEKKIEVGGSNSLQ